MPVGSDSHASFLARRLEDLGVVDAAQRDDAISVDFGDEDDEDFVLESAMDLATSQPSMSVPPVRVEVAEVGYVQAGRMPTPLPTPLSPPPAETLAPPPPRRPGRVLEAPSAPVVEKPARRPFPWKRMLGHLPAVGVGLGLAVAAVADGVGPPLVRYGILAVGLVLSGVWVGLQRAEPAGRWVRAILWSGLVAAAFLPAALVALSDLSFRGAGMGYLVVGLLGAVAQLVVGAGETQAVPVTTAQAPRPRTVTGPHVFHPSGAEETPADAGD